MKAIKDSVIEVKIVDHGTWYEWIVSRMYQNGLCTMDSQKSFASERTAKNHFERFAKLNGITKYKFI